MKLLQISSSVIWLLIFCVIKITWKISTTIQLCCSVFEIVSECISIWMLGLHLLAYLMFVSPKYCTLNRNEDYSLLCVTQLCCHINCLSVKHVTTNKGEVRWNVSTISVDKEREILTKTRSWTADTYSVIPASELQWKYYSSRSVMMNFHEVTVIILQ